MSDVFDYSEYFAEDVKNLGKYLDEESAGLVLTQTMRTGATKKIKDAKCNTVNEFLDKTAEAVVLEAVKSPNGVENLKKVLDDFEYATGISGDLVSIFTHTYGSTGHGNRVQQMKKLGNMLSFGIMGMTFHESSFYKS